MHPRTILILEDDEDPARDFRTAAASLGQDFIVRVWSDAQSTIAEAPACFAKACVISLDHDLQAMGGDTDPTGLEVAEFLNLHAPMCPVILHTSNYDRRMSMHNKLRGGRWTVATVPLREAD